MSNLLQSIYNIQNSEDFEGIALKIFDYQASNNQVYKKFLELLGTDVSAVDSITKIPFLPIGFYKNFVIQSGVWEGEKKFLSSGTTGSVPSVHHVRFLKDYHHQLDQSFKYFYGAYQDYIIYPLLPGYAERQGSSLIAMVDHWMQQTKQSNKTYYIHNFQQLHTDLQNHPKEKKAIVIGVTYALLDFAEQYSIPQAKTIVMETGGMKGNRAEISKETLHHILKEKLQIDEVHSEYGMTELLSQSYAKNSTYFQTPPWKKILIREREDPMSYVESGKTGGINVIDLANLHTCSFIATDDLGQTNNQNQFKVLGRYQSSDVRGCNLMVLS
ncbi:MAG: acyl transferase [Weeksellaceae bacterium]|nr:acyl transferase [Weeksellaceae bacterium]